MSRGICNLGSSLHRLDGTLNQFGCILGSLGALPCQAPHLICNHSKTLTCHARPGGLHGCVQRQNVRLESDILYGLDDLADLVGSTSDLLHGRHHVLHLGIALFHLVSSCVGLFFRLVGIFRGALHLVGNICNGGGKLLDGGSLLGSALSQSLCSVGHLAGP